VSKLLYKIIYRNTAQRGQPKNWHGTRAGRVVGAISVMWPLINLILNTIIFKKKYKNTLNITQNFMKYS